MKRTNKHVSCWDKDKRDSGNCFRNYNGNYTEREENMENFRFDVWLREMLHKWIKLYGDNTMEYIIENLTKREIDIMESSDIEWCPDDISSDSTDIVVFNKKDLDKTLYLIGRKR